MRRKIFITGTDTGVGKTVFTSLLLAHALDNGIHALAMKPFCSGGTGDVDMILALQGDVLAREEVNPFLFAEPVAPLVAARKQSCVVPRERVAEKIESLSARCDLLLIEGAGGLLAPLGEEAVDPGATNNWTRTYNLLDIACRLGGDFVVVAMNKLGVINHTLLTLSELERARVKNPLGTITTVLNEPYQTDQSTHTNASMLQEALHPAPLVRIPFLPNPLSAALIREVAKNLRKPLESVLG